MARVLVADDAAIVRKVVREMLERAGHVVAGEAANGEQVLELYEELRPDLAILDVNMPELDGISAAETIRRRHPKAPLILASVFVNETRLARVLTLAGVEYVMKPFDAEQLLDAIGRVSPA